MAVVVRALADEVDGRIPPPPPIYQDSAATLRQEISKHYQSSSSPIPSRLTDIVTLTQNLASIVGPLYVDIHATFVDNAQNADRHPRTELGEA